MKANKRILCVILALLMCLFATMIAVSAEDVQEQNQRYKDIVFGALGEYVNPEYHFYRCEYAYNADGTTPDEGEVPDYILAWVSAEAVHETILQQVIGDYYFSQPHCYSPYDLGYFICSTKDNRCYSLEAAWEYQLPNTEAVLAMLGTHIDEVNNEYTRYRKQVVSALGWEEYTQPINYRCIYEFMADGSSAAEGATADYALIYAHTGAWTEGLHYSVIGDYRLNVSDDFYPGYLIYSVKENKLITLRQAYNDNLPGMDKVLEAAGTRITLCSRNFEEYLKNTIEFKEIENAFDIINDDWYSYKELYYYTDGKGAQKMPEATPDYVLISGSFNANSPSLSFGVIGDYVLHCENCGNPDCLRYFVCTPENGKVYTLQGAYNEGVEGILNVFTDYGLGHLMGDADNDRKLTIKDATYIQKYVARFEGIEEPFGFTGHNVYEYGDYYVSVADFDENNDINIKDATAIQKRLAKI